MPDTQRTHITDLGHANRDETDVIMTKIRDMNPTPARPDASQRPRAAIR
jgi:hypothetical protein